MKTNRSDADCADLLDFYFNHGANYGEGRMHWSVSSPLGKLWVLQRWDGDKWVWEESDAERGDYPTPQDAIAEGRRRAICGGYWNSIEDADDN